MPEKKEAGLVKVQQSVLIDERVSAIIENRKFRAMAAANSETTLMFWDVGRFISNVTLDNSARLMEKGF